MLKVSPFRAASFFENGVSPRGNFFMCWLRALFVQVSRHSNPFICNSSGTVLPFLRNRNASEAMRLSHNSSCSNVLTDRL